MLLAGSQDTVVAVRKAGDQLVVCNVDADKYPEKEFSVDPAQASLLFCGVLYNVIYFLPLVACPRPPRVARRGKCSLQRGCRHPHALGAA